MLSDIHDAESDGPEGLQPTPSYTPSSYPANESVSDDPPPQPTNPQAKAHAHRKLRHQYCHEQHGREEYAGASKAIMNVSLPLIPINWGEAPKPATKGLYATQPNQQTGTRPVSLHQTLHFGFHKVAWDGQYAKVYCSCCSD
jgi:hypothetical protein